MPTSMARVQTGQAEGPMGIVDRFTRDKVSRWIWGGLTLACLAALLFAYRGERDELTDQVNAAEERAALYANTVIYYAVQADDPGSSDVHFLYRDLYVDVQGGIFTDPTVALVRIWDAEGVLRFSTEATERELIGQQQVTDDPGVQAAVTERRITSRKTTASFTRATTGTPAQPTQLLQVFTPLMAPTRIEPLGAVQIDFLYDLLADASRNPWLTWQIVFAGLTALFALLTVLSLRRSVQPIGAGTAEGHRVVVAKGTVPATGQGDPPGEDRSELERAAALEAELEGMREELQASREQLRQAEEAYRYLEVRMRKTQEEMARAENQAAVGDDTTPAVDDADERARASERRIATLESRLAEAEARTREAEAAMTSWMTDPQATDDVKATPAGPVPRSPEAPAAVTVDASALARLEARIEAAERRAAEAEERLTELTPEASDLRTRLARTAARKKLRPEDESDA